MFGRKVKIGDIMNREKFSILIFISFCFCLSQLKADVLFQSDKHPVNFPSLSKKLSEQLKYVYTNLQYDNIKPLLSSIDGDKNSIEYATQVLQINHLSKLMSSSDFCTLRSGSVSIYTDKLSKDEVCVIVWNAISGFYNSSNINGTKIENINGSIYNQIHIWKMNKLSNHITLEIPDLGKLAMIKNINK